MTRFTSTMSSGLAVIIALGAAGALTGCQAPAQKSYQLTDTETVTDPTSGVRKQISHWQYLDGTTTKSVKTVFRIDAGRPPRGSKGQHP